MKAFLRSLLATAFAIASITQVWAASGATSVSVLDSGSTARTVNVYSSTGAVTGLLSWMNVICDYVTLTTCANVGTAGSPSTNALTVQAVTLGHGTAANAMRVELPTDGTGVVGLNAGSNLVGGVNIVDSAGTNKAGVDAAHNVLTSDGGTATVVITASSAGAVKATPGRLCRVLTTSLATAAVNIYDNTNAASGTILATVPATTVAGTAYNCQMPAAVGIYVGGGAGTPGLTVSYS